MRHLKFAFGLLLTTGLVSCGSYKESYNDNGSRVQRFKTLSFQAVRESVLRPQCFDCHSNANAAKGGNIAFENLPDLRRLLPQILSDLDTDKMPKDRAALPENLKAIVRLWAQNNAPEDSNIPLPGGDQPPVPTQRLLVGFDQVRTKLFEPYCIRCHSILSDREQVIKNIDKVLGAVDSGKMPKGATRPLNDKVKALLHNWVDDGMLAGVEEVQQKILIPYCIRCHGGFRNGESVAKQALSIWSAVWSDEMPRGGGPVPMELKMLLDKWFKEGAPN